MACAVDGRPVTLEGLDGADNPAWGALGTQAWPLGVRATYALPLPSSSQPLGVLHLFGAAPLPEASLSVSRSLAEVTALSLLGADPSIDAAVVARHLHLAIEARVTVEQAKGVLAARFDTTPHLAGARLLAAAARTGRPLGEVAAAVVERTTDATLDDALALPPAPLDR